MTIEIRIDPFPDRESHAALSAAAWDAPLETTYDLANVLKRSLVHLGAYDGERLVGYLNVAWDGAMHAFLLDPMVHPDYRHRRLGTELVKRATACTRERGAGYLHVDYEPHLDAFYQACGFKPTRAGLIRLDR